MSHKRMTTLAFLLLELSPFVLFLILISCMLCLIVFGRNVEQDETMHHVQE